MITKEGPSVAPKITPERIKELLGRVTVHTTTGAHPTPHVTATAWLDGKFFLATAISKAVNPENFDEGLGVKYSTIDALRASESKLWELEGYALYSRQ